MIDKLGGRRQLVIFCNISYIIISLAEMYSQFYWLVFCRIMFGVTVGFVLSSAPKIIIETVPSHLLEYGFGSATNVFTFVSIAIYSTLNSLNTSTTEEKNGGQTWRIVYLFPIPFSAISLLGFLTIYKNDSPTYLIEKGASKKEVLESVNAIVNFESMALADKTEF